TGDQGQNLDDFIAKQAELAKRKFSVQSLGSFTVEIKTPKEETHRAAGVMNLADLEIVVECDVKSTCDFVEGRTAQIRNLVTDVLVPMEREDLLSKSGKAALKKKIIEKINSWLPAGKIENLYFDKLVVN